MALSFALAVLTHSVEYIAPKGLESGFINWDDEDTNNRNLYSGQLPDGS